MMRFVLLPLMILATLAMTACGGSSSGGSVLTAPAAPQNVQAQAGGGEVVLGWDATATASSYNLYRNETGGVTTADEEFVGVTSPYTDTSRINGTTYYYILVAVNSTGESDASAEVMATPNSIPQNVKVAPGDTKITISWDPVSDATAYNIYWNTTGTVTTGDTQIANASSLDEHTGIANGTEHFYVVTAFNGSGETLPSAEVSTSPTVPTEYFVSSTAVDDSGDGLTVGTAKQTITAAISAATAPAVIYVNAGTYTVGTNNPRVVMKDGVSLMGGYDADFNPLTSAPLTNITVITDTGRAVTGNISTPNHAVEAGAGVGGATVFDGFVVNGSDDATADYTTAIWIHDGGALTVQNSTLNGGGGSHASFGIASIGSSPRIRNNTAITGGTTSEVSYGLYNYNQSSPQVTGNTLISGGDDTNISSAAVFNGFHSSPLIEANLLVGGDGSTSSMGIYNHTASMSLVHNNLIDAGTGNTAYGIRIRASAPIIRNNTIFGGNKVRAYGLYYSQASTPTIDNNIIFAGVIPTAEAGSYCLYENGAGNNPVSVRNNNLFNCKTVYRNGDVVTAAEPNPDPGCDGDGDGDTDVTTCSLAEMEARTDYGAGGASGNTAVDPGLVSISGADRAEGWKLAALSPMIAIGLNGEDGGWGFLTDFAGNPRPGTTLSWSTGAYEPTP